MKNNRLDKDLDNIIRISMETTDQPTPELNNSLKVAVYQRETAMRKIPTTRSLSLWYFPMALNLITFSMLAIVALMLIDNAYLSYLIAGICIYIGLVGVFLTIVGIKRTNLKDDITIRIQKRGVLA